MQNACRALKIGPWQGIGKHKALVAVGFVLLALVFALMMTNGHRPRVALVVLASACAVPLYMHQQPI